MSLGGKLVFIRKKKIKMKSPWLLAAVLVVCAGLIGWLTRPPEQVTAAKEKESRRHPAPPADLQTVNQQIGQSIANATLETMSAQAVPLGSLLQGKPMVLVFFSHDCDCSLEFARYFVTAMQASQTKADWHFVFPDTPEQISTFTSKAGLSLPSLRDPGAELSRKLGVTKSGPFVLVDPQGVVIAIWPGVSLTGLEDLFSRLKLPPLSASQLSGIPQSPTAGCPLHP